MTSDSTKSGLRRGWTTGTCATAASRAAAQALVTGIFPDQVTVKLPGGARPAFALALEETGPGFARAGIVKDAGDDPDVTHGALVIATIRPGSVGSGIVFRAGPGVGMVTRPGLPIPPGEPAINPVPRAMIREALAEARTQWGAPADLDVEIAIPGGEELARRTLNARLGIVGGLSILGTTGIVIPYSCAAWIDTIHRGIDVARAMGLRHIAGATGDVSEKAVQHLHALPEEALIEMGDFVGGMLKYLRRHPVHQVTIAGGFAKMVKLGQGLMDLHSRAGPVDMAFLADLTERAGGDGVLAGAVRALPSAAEALFVTRQAGIALGPSVAHHAWQAASRALAGNSLRLDIVVVNRDGTILARTASVPVEA